MRACFRLRAIQATRSSCPLLRTERAAVFIELLLQNRILRLARRPEPSPHIGIIGKCHPAGCAAALARATCLARCSCMYTESAA